MSHESKVRRAIDEALSLQWDAAYTAGVVDAAHMALDVYQYHLSRDEPVEAGVAKAIADRIRASLTSEEKITDLALQEANPGTEVEADRAASPENRDGTAMQSVAGEKQSR